MRNNKLKIVSICMAFLLTCPIFCMNDVFASEKTPLDYDKICIQHPVH